MVWRGAPGSIHGKVGFFCYWFPPTTDIASHILSPSRPTTPATRTTNNCFPTHAIFVTTTTNHRSCGNNHPPVEPAEDSTADAPDNEYEKTIVDGRSRRRHWRMLQLWTSRMILVSRLKGNLRLQPSSTRTTHTTRPTKTTTLSLHARRQIADAESWNARDS